MKIEQRIARAKNLIKKHQINAENPQLMLLVWDEMRSANFRLAILIGTNAVLVALLLAVIIRG